MGEKLGDAWLPLAEAAERLGVSRLRVREGIAAGAIRAQRDNRGLWRVTLDEAPASLSRRLADLRIDPTALVGILFDEIEEANLALADRDSDVDRLSALVARHEDLLERALSLAESTRKAPATGGEGIERLGVLAERSDALIARTIGALEKKEADLKRMTGLADRAVSTAAALDAEVARQAETSKKRDALLDRVLALAHASVERISAPGRAGGFFGRVRSRLARDKDARG